MIQLVLLLISELLLVHVYQGDMVLASYANNILSHALLSTLAIGVYFSSSDMEIKVDDAKFELFCGEWLKWYFVLDLMRMLTGIIKLQGIYVAHHLFGISLITMIEHSGMLHRYIPVICLFEVSSVPLNVRYALLHIGRDKMSKQVIYSEIVFFVTFILVRWGFGFRRAYEIIVRLYEIEEKTRLEKNVTITTSIVVLMFLLMHVHWTFGIFKRVLKYINKWRVSRRHKIPLKNKFKMP